MIYCDIDLVIFSLEERVGVFCVSGFGGLRRRCFFVVLTTRVSRGRYGIPPLTPPPSGTVPKIVIGRWPITIFSFMSPLEPPIDRDSYYWMSWTVRWLKFGFTMLPQKVIRFVVEICGVVVLWTRPQLIVLRSLSVLSCDEVCFCVSVVLSTVVQKNRKLVIEVLIKGILQPNSLTKAM